jgi:hypothetical protein
MRALEPQDVLVACRLALGNRKPRKGKGNGEPTRRELADELCLSLCCVQRAVQRLAAMKVLIAAPSRRGGVTVVPAKLFHLLVNVVPILCPAKKTGAARGLPTSVFSPEFKATFAGERLPLVWPYARGEAGDGLTPIHPSVPRASAKNPALYQLLAAVDVLRVGIGRERDAAMKYVSEVLAKDVKDDDDNTDEGDEDGNNS